MATAGLLPPGIDACVFSTSGLAAWATVGWHHNRCWIASASHGVVLCCYAHSGRGGCAAGCPGLCYQIKMDASVLI